MSLVSNLLLKASERLNFTREKFIEKQQPTESDSLLAVINFGDLHSTFVLSSILLKNWKEQLKSSKYLVVCGWKGQQNLFPYADEYWSPPNNNIKSVLNSAKGFKNYSDTSTVWLQTLNEYFPETADFRKIVDPYYNLGFNENFWKTYNKPSFIMPAISSSAVLGKDFNNNFIKSSGNKIFIHPTFFMKNWNNGICEQITVDKEFWKNLLTSLIEEGYYPVIWQNYETYDLSPEFYDKCIIYQENDLSKVLSLMRLTGVVLDLFQDLSKLATVARCACVSYKERFIYNKTKDYEIESIFNLKNPYLNIFSFNTPIVYGNLSVWKTQVYGGIIKSLNEFIPTLERDNWLQTNEINEVIPVQQIKQFKIKDLGLRLFNIKEE
jgi:hypothetical protein